MEFVAAGQRFIRFGVFEMDLECGELRKAGVLVHLPPQPFKILAVLASRAGQLVTREEIHRQIWGNEAFVDFGQGLNHCIKQIRTVLRDDAESPHYVETLPRRGYRFIAPVEAVVPVSSPAADQRSETAPTEAAETRRVPRRFRIVAVALMAAIGAGILLVLSVAGLRGRVFRAVGVGRELPLHIQSLAVLPFENLSRDPAQEYFADGMTEQLITDLGKISALRVISRTSVMQYKGTKKPLPQIARELNVDAIVEGTVERSENRMRITANLLYGPTDRHLWAESYKRDQRDVLALQDEVARAISDEVKAKLTPEVQARLVKARPVDPEAYEAYLKGRIILDNWTEESCQSAIKYFEAAIERDPRFAPAFAGLADAHIFLGRFHYRPAKETFLEAKQAARKALALDPNSAEAYSSLCAVATFYDWDWPAAEIACARAIELNPSYGPAHHVYSHYFMSTGRFAESLRESLRYLELDPLSPAAKTHLGTHYKMARQYDPAIEVLRKTVEFAPNFPDAYGELASSYIGKGAYREAFAPAQKAVALTGGKGYLGLVGEAYAMAGRRNEAIKVLAEITGTSRGGFAPARTTVPILIALGEKDRAIEELQRAFEEHDQLIPYLKVWSMFDPLRSDPRFQDLLRGMHFRP
ncbi:MAG TPA: winged helix-turn-helix domain-containing protein [Bryobacteraceae bacterium]|nr:winged helix-turn-helix domain-containing protein [Bryobacteraceae bacterium]